MAKDKREVDVEEIIEMISEDLRTADGERIAFIADQTLTADVKYLGDNIFEVKE